MRLKTSLAVLVAAVAAAGCKNDPDPDPVCDRAAVGDVCAAPADCCSDLCAPNNICVREDCFAAGGSCTAPSDCCNGQCENLTCLGTELLPNGSDCTADSQCQSGYCTPASPRRCGPPPPPPCLPQGDACTGATADSCCSRVCGATNVCTRPICNLPGEDCRDDWDCCSLSCSSPGTPGATCLTPQCRQALTSCTDPGQCCSEICTGGSCQEVPPGPTGETCKTLGEACAYPADCCSTNCQGSSAPGVADGTCRPASECNAKGDICSSGLDCCSGLCAPPAAAGQPGRCDDAPGDCTQDGLPCTGNSNCCTRLCQDIGYGATVCQPSGGCRMTGNYCDSTAACCGGTNVTDPTLPNDYGVFCDLVGSDPAYPRWDTSTQDSLTCTRGQGCNPPGNICGDIASQNCCNGKKDVCKYDESGIKRCFGGPPACCGSTGCGGCCLTGWDPYDPACCKDIGEVCEFRDQCCDRAPCVPDASGVLRCGQGCLPRGTTCTGTSDTRCCSPLTCQMVEGAGFICTDVTPPPPSCTVAAGGACTVPEQAPPACCGPGLICSTPGGTPTGPGTCAACAPRGNYCDADSDCCSNRCDVEMGACLAVCITDGGTCTVGGDCCSGSCDIASGQTSGTCVPGGGCSATGGSCATLPCCVSTDTCVGGFCTAACQSQGVTCTNVVSPGQPAVQGDCCSSLLCYAQDQYGGLLPCTAGAAGGCSCQPQCVGTTQGCSTVVQCCTSSQSTCRDGGGAICTSATLGSCTCVPNG